MRDPYHHVSIINSIMVRTSFLLGIDMIYREIIDLNDSLFFRAHGAPDQIIRWHYHPQYELHYIKDTNGTVYIGDFVGKFVPGQLVLVGPNLPHNWVSSLREGLHSRERSWALVFEQEIIHTILSTFPSENKVLKLLKDSRRGIQFNGNTERIVDLMRQFQDLKGLSRIGIFLQLVHEMAEHPNKIFLASHSVITDQLDYIQSEKIDNILDYINNNSDKQITLEDIGKEFSSTASSISRYFKKKTGVNVINYLNRLRITKACFLLQSTTLSVKEISEQVGFSNSSYFIKMFSEQKKITPKQFRTKFGHDK